MVRARILLLGLSIALYPVLLWANAPAPRWACDGKKVGDKCGEGTYYDGYCELLALIEIQRRRRA